MMFKKLKGTIGGIVSLILCLSIIFTAFPVSATSGSFTGGQIHTGYRLKITYSESEQNPITNKSKVTAKLYLVQDKYYDLYIGTRSATITINGVTTNISNIPAIRNSGNVTTHLGTAATTVTHTSDGSKSVTIAATFNMNATLGGTYYGTMSTSKTVALDKLDRTAPTVSLKYNSSTNSSVNLTATANVSCNIWQYSLDNGSWVTFGSTGTTNTFNISNLTSGSTHSVKVRARKTSNNVYSANSSNVSATVKPGNPGNLSVSNISDTSAKLNWGSVSGATSYKVYKDGTAVSSGITANNYTFTGLTSNTNYTLGVLATNAGGNSSLVTKDNVITKPGTPLGLNASRESCSEVNLSWSAPNGGNAESLHYDIYRDESLIDTTDDTQYLDQSYTNTNSSYTVRAVNSAGFSSDSSPAAVTYEPPAISLTSSENDHTYTTIIPTVTGGYGNANTLKWAYGEKNADYFDDNGVTFNDNLYVVRNGTYTIFVVDSLGNTALDTVTISNIFTDNTIGAYTQTFTDLYVDSVGIPVSFERTYNSMDTASNLFGSGWSLNYAKKTVLSNDETVRLVYLPDGSVNYFTVNADNTYSPIRSQNTLFVNENTFTLSVKDGYIYTYTNDYLTSIKDAHNNEIVIQLNSDNLPRKIIDSVGREYNITYNSDNRISCITDPAGRTITYNYTDAGYLEIFNDFGNIATEQYYYTDGLLTKILDLQSNQSTEITYYSNNQIASLKQDDETTYYSYGVSSTGQASISESEAEEEPIVNEYDAFGQLITDSTGYAYIYNNDGTVSRKAALNTDHILITYTYDTNGNLIEERTVEIAEDTVTEILKSVISYVYTYFDNTEKISSATETTVSYTYDENDVASTDTTAVFCTYNIYGELLSEQTTHNNDTDNKTYSYLSSGLLSSETADGKTVEYTYNTNGYATNIQTTEGDSETNISITYNIIGQVISQTESGLTVNNIYDLFGNVIKSTQTDNNTTCISRIVYDNNNRVIQKIDSQQYSASDDALNPDSNGICSVNIYNNNTVGERYTYDANGNVSTYINRADNKTVNTYDSENRLVKTVTYETQSETSNSLTTRYIYNADGNLIQTVYPHQYNSANDNLDVANEINEYTDNTIGERVTYDENGNIVTYTDSLGKQTVNTYDAGNHLVKSVTDGETTRFVYNGGDNLLQIIYPDQYVAADDNLDLEAETPVDTYSDSTIGDRYTYDDEGNVLTYTDRFGNVTTNTYDSDGNLTATTKPDGAVFSFDSDGKVTTEIYSNGLVNNVTYTSDQTVIAGSNGITVTYQNNSFGETAVYSLQNGENYKNYTYTYDYAGNILTISLNNVLQQTFTYNASNELVRVDDVVANKSVTYEYDFVGNITSVNTYNYTTATLGMPLTTQAYTYNSQNQRTDLSYDSYGNLSAYNGYSFGWSERRLTSAISNDNNISYAYNSVGIRTCKTVNGTTTYYEVDENNNVVKQYELVNNEETNVIEFVYDSSNTPVYFTYNNSTYYYEKNLQGDIVGILDGQGDSVVQYTYDIWGKLLSTTGTLASTIGEINPIRYRGYYYDTETELYYLQSRYYSPELMRFISQDDPVLSNNQGEPLGSNLYAYCLNNPVNFVDPTGHWVLTLGISFGAAVILGLNFFVTLLIDSTGDFGLFIGTTLLYGVVGKGISYSPGFYWKFNKIKSYLDSITNSLTIGYGVGGSLVFHYYKYPSSKKRIVGVHVSYGAKGIYWETATFDGGFYIPLKKYLSSIFKKYGTNIVAIKNMIKTFRINFYSR